MSSYDSFLLRLIDKTQSGSPVGITEGGLIAGDISPFFIRSEMEHSITEKTSNVTVVLYIPESGIFSTAAPKLLAEDAQDKYYLEAQIEQDSVFTRVFRMRIGQPTLIQEANIGEAIKIPVVGIEYIAKEFPVSRQDDSVSAKQRFLNLSTYYNSTKGADNPALNTPAGNVDLPDVPLLNYKTFAPVMLQRQYKELIDQQVQPGAAGASFKDKFVDYIPSPSFTNQVDVHVKDFGGVSSGLTINSETTDIPSTPEKKTGIADQLRRKNIVIYKFHPAGASLPMEKTRFESKFNHARLRIEWSSSVAYAVGDLVKLTDTTKTPFVIRYFTAINVSGPTATTPDANTTDWTEDFTIIPPHSTDALYDIGEIIYIVTAGNVEHYEATIKQQPGVNTPPGTGWTKIYTTRADSNHADFIENSPWTNDLDLVKKSCLMGQNNIPVGDNGIVYQGVVPDWNMEVPVYDRVDYTNDFKHVSGRSCRDQQNAPPTGRNLFHFSRYLVGAAGTGAWSGQSNKIATYVRLPLEDTANPQWKFSDAPVEGDTIFLEDMAQVMKFISGSWQIAHDVDTNNDKPTPYHLCAGIKLVKDKSDLPGQAVELDFNWELNIDGGDDNNRGSRGAWYYEEYPLPTRDSTNFNIGGKYGGDGSAFPGRPFINSNNLDNNRKGFLGWNSGLDSEDQGRIGVHVIAVKMAFLRSTATEELTGPKVLTKGIANIPVVYWRRDLFGRMYFFETTIDRNDQWAILRVPIPPVGSPTQLYHNRLDELSSPYGYTIPTIFGLPEKEFSGVRFSEKFAKSWGVFYKTPYNNDGFYNGMYDNFFQSFIEAAAQIGPDIIEIADKIQQGDFSGIGLFSEGSTNHVTLAVGNLYYEKEGYALSRDTSINNPRYHIERDEAETDYDNAKVKARALELRKTEILSEWHFTAAGDVRMEAGKTFLLDGPNIPDGPLTLVCQSVKHIIDNDQVYNMEVYAILKRVTPI